MIPWRRITIAAVILLGGCTYHARENADESVAALTCHSYDEQVRVGQFAGADCTAR